MDGAIFIPSLNLATTIYVENPALNTGNIRGTAPKILFQQPNCVYAPDTTYIDSRSPIGWQTLIRVSSSEGDRYFYSISPQENVVIGLASKLLHSGECVEGSYGESGVGYKVIEILEADIPFTLPVALPLKYELQAR